MDAFQQGLDVQPAFPEGFPSRLSIALAPQIASGLSNAMPASSRRQVLGSYLAQMRDDLDHLGGQDLAGRSLRLLTGRRPHLQEPDRQGSQKA